MPSSFAGEILLRDLWSLFCSIHFLETTAVPSATDSLAALYVSLLIALSTWNRGVTSDLMIVHLSWLVSFTQQELQNIHGRRLISTLFTSEFCQSSAWISREVMVVGSWLLWKVHWQVEKYSSKPQRQHTWSHLVSGFWKNSGIINVSRLRETIAPPKLFEGFASLKWQVFRCHALDFLERTLNGLNSKH